MSSLLEEKIKAIMMNEKHKKPSDDENTDDDLDTDKDDDTDVDDSDKDSDDKKIGKSKKDVPEVKESCISNLGKDLSGVGKETSKGEDNSKIDAGKSRKLGSAEKLSDKVRKDKQEDNGDNAKIQAGEGRGDKKGGRLSSPTHEHIEAMFDGEELTEEFKTKAEAIFEAAVQTVADERMEALQEEYQEKLDEAVEEVKGELVEQIDGYLDVIVEQWIQDNAVALESGIKVELVNSFISGMKNLFQEHYIDIPEDKLDVVEEQSLRIEELEEALIEISEEKEIAVNESLVIQCESVVSDFISGLTAIEEDKFRSLTENIEFDTIDEFTTKVKTIRESYFKGSKNNSQDVTSVKGTIEESKETSGAPSAVLNALKKGNLNLFGRN